jgi:hypothetical protein
MFSKPGSVDLNKTLNDLIQAGQRDPNILLKYSQNPPPEFGSQGKLLVSLAASAVARDKSATKTMQPSPTKTIAEQINNKLVESTQPQGIAGLNNQAAPTQAGINSPTAAPAPQSMDGGVASLPVDEGMYNEQNFANGGIVSFAAGGKPAYDYKYDYEKYYNDPAGSLMEVPDVPTPDDLKMQTQALKSNFVDPNYYGDTEKSIKADTLADLADVKRMGQSDILFKLAEGFGTTPGGFVRGAVAAGTKAGPAVAEMNKSMLAAKRLERDATNKLKQSKYAESIGDYKTATELKMSAEKDAFEAKKTNATLNTQLGLARAKALKGAGLDEAKLRVQVEKVAVEKMKAQYPAGAYEALMRDRPDVYSAELNRYKKETEGYILNNITAKNLPANYMENLQKNKVNATLAGSKAPITAQPANRSKLLNKYPATGSRSANTQAELSTDWGSAGPHEPEDDESQ